MLNENIKNLRKAKGLSQEELANRLNVVRQTISKWEKGLSVPDSSMLISLADELDTSVSTLLGETVPEHDLKDTDLKSISEKLESINLQFAKRSRMPDAACFPPSSKNGTKFSGFIFMLRKRKIAARLHAAKTETIAPVRPIVSIPFHAAYEAESAVTIAISAREACGSIIFAIKS